MSDRRKMILGDLAKPGPELARQMKQVRFNPIRHCTPTTLARDLDMFEAGYLRNAALLWEAIEQRDDMVCPSSLKRRSAVSARKFEIVMTEESDEAAAHKEALEYCLNHLTVTDALDLNVKGTFSDLVEQMMGAMLHRYAVHEILWKPGRRDSQGRPAITAELRFCPLYLFDNVSGRLGYTGALSVSEGQPLSDEGWMITCGDGLMRAISVAWMFKRLSLTDWLNFSEKFGIPGIHGTTNAVKGSQEWDDFLNALEKFANDWIMASAQGSDVKLIEVGKTGDAPFKPMVERMDRSLAILILGSDLATLSRENGAGASLQGQSTEYLLARDCERMSSSLQVNIGRKVIEMLFGEGTEPLAYIQIPPPKNQDIDQDIKVDNHLHKLGVPMSREDVLERYSRTLPDDDETLLSPPAKREAQQKRTAALENARGDVQHQNVLDALLDDLQPVREAIATALQASDGDLEQALKDLEAKWPDVLSAVMRGDALEQAIESVLGEAFVAGLDLEELVEEAAFANANPYHDARGRFTSKANAISEVVTAAQDPNVNEAVIEDYHAVTQSEALKLQKATGLDLAGYTHSLDNYSVKHILKVHGDGSTEALRGQLPVTAQDFAHLPEIVSKWDKVEHVGQTKQGREALQYTKTIGDTMYLVEEVRTKKKKLVPVTLYKRRAAPDAR